MKAAYIERTGPIADVVRIGERPAPEPRGDQVLIEVRAAAVNPRDWLLAEGRYVFAALAGRMPLVLGSDVAGVVVGTGPRARRFAPGDEVLAMQTPRGRFGGFAERVAVRQGAVGRKPEGVAWQDAAAIGVAGLTALQALRDDARLEAGERVVVVGASGGVGTFAVQLARILGAGQVVGICSGRNAELVRGLGADRVIDYESADFRDAVGAVDVVFDTIGRGSLAGVRRCLAPGGRYVATVPSGRNAADQLLGATLGRLRPRSPRSRTVLCRARGDDLERLAGLVAEGRLRVVIDSVFPLEEVAEALARSRTRRARGRIVLVPRPPAAG